MRLLRVQVPEFRVLKDVDISFEPDFTRQVFPLGSLNGGGKSTLLQLIFVLLTHFSQSTSNINKGRTRLRPNRLETRISNTYFENIFSEIKFDTAPNPQSLASITLSVSDEEISLEYFYCVTNDEFNKNNKYFEREIGGGWLTGVVNFKNSINSEKISKIKEEISNRIFLVSPSNQPYLFLSREERRALFTENNKPQYDQAVKNAQKKLSNFFTFDFVDVLVEVFRRARAKDFKERNKDNPFAHTEKLESDINSLFIDGKKITSLIIEQQRHTQDEIQGVFFTLPSGQEIYPEDLSHGELKRLAIFVLIKYHEMQDAIVLIDEIENGFHPDWQRHIVDDLVEWGASNQYILATHSYELCRGVTAAHIKELEPKLIS